MMKRSCGKHRSYVQCLSRAYGYTSGIGTIFLARRPAGIVTLTCSAWAIAIVVAIRCVAPAVVDQQSMKRPLDEASKSGFGTTPVVEMHTIERTTEFYAGGPPDARSRRRGPQTRRSSTVPSKSQVKRTRRVW